MNRHSRPSVSPVQPEHPLTSTPHRSLDRLRELPQRALILLILRDAARLVGRHAERAFERGLARGPA